MKKYNFYAGPAILPASVMAEAAKAVVEFEGIGLSLLEISHRSKEVVAILNEAQSLIRELLGLSDDFSVLFLTGGASTQFFTVAHNLLNKDKKAGYVDTGSWSTKAIKEAKAFGQIDVLASSKDKNYSYIPKGYDIPSDLTYLHVTGNNTIFGTQMHDFPETSIPLVCDMSSDIFSRPIDTSRFGIIYAGAQKNLGPAGVTLAIVRKDFLEMTQRELPTMLNYNTHVQKNSSFNTPPVFPIYVSMLTLRWLKANGGLSAMAQKNEDKAKLLYDEIDSNPLFTGVAAMEDRSLMNATFVMAEGKEDLAEEFLADCAAAGCIGVKGHRSVGGFRASIYNAMPKAGVETLVGIMKAFAYKH
ncbi:MAG: 3-phosphoserine/phosphohydroxythreonine transaminase [Saprospiraceae bacterium]|nr:3-phosphoserine/phosphohydroxythreonine transaminase [Saprospiraceae bacterium]